MKMLLLSIFVVCAVLPLPLRSETGEEARLIAVIQSSASPAEKEDACRQIKRIGTTNSVAALSSLLTDEHLYQAACDALETMPFKAAEAALLSALGITEGKTKAGIIHAIGEHRLERGEPRNRSTVSLLAPLLKDTDPLIASAAARALGQVGEINGREAANALLATVKTATEPTRSAEVDALLHWEQADWEMVMKISQQFGDLNENENVRIAAFRSLLGATLAGGYPGTYEISNALVLKLVVEGIEGDDNARLIEALRFARDVILSGISLNVKAVPAFTNLFPKTSPAKQAALISLLQESRAVAAAPAVLELAGSKDSYVRATALAALGTLGDASVVPQLA